MNMANWFVVIMGIVTVFIGLICIVILCKIVGFFCRGKESKAKEAPAAPAAVPAKSDAPIQNRREVIAAVSAVLAEEMECDVSALRIHSFKKI